MDVQIMRALKMAKDNQASLKNASSLLLNSGNNLCDFNRITSGFYLGSGGVPVAASGRCYTDYIPVTEGQTYCFFGAWSLSFQAVLYTANKTFIKCVYATDLTGTLGSYTYAIPTGMAVGYMRVNVSTTQSQTMVVPGTTYPSTYSSSSLSLSSNILATAIKNSLNLAEYTDINYNTSLGQNNLVSPNQTKYATAIGYGALQHNTTDGSQDAGLYNVAVGYNALNQNTIGNHNTAVGWQAAASITTGTGETAVGEDALLSETTGVGNVAIGQRALQTSNGAQNNTAVGTSSMYWDPTSNVTGSDNTAVGHYAGSGLTSDTSLTFLGTSANKNSSANTFTDSTALGAQSHITASHQVMLGSSTVTEVDTYGDFQVLTKGKGILMLDQTTGTRYRLFINNGAIVIQPV